MTDGMRCLTCEHMNRYNRGEIYDHHNHYKCTYWNMELSEKFMQRGCEKYGDVDEKVKE